MNNNTKQSTSSYYEAFIVYKDGSGPAKKKYVPSFDRPKRNSKTKNDTVGLVRLLDYISKRRINIEVVEIYDKRNGGKVIYKEVNGTVLVNITMQGSSHGRL